MKAVRSIKAAPGKGNSTAGAIMNVDLSMDRYDMATLKLGEAKAVLQMYLGRAAGTECDHAALHVVRDLIEDAEAALDTEHGSEEKRS